MTRGHSKVATSVRVCAMCKSLESLALWLVLAGHFSSRRNAKRVSRVLGCCILQYHTNADIHTQPRNKQTAWNSLRGMHWILTVCIISTGRRALVLVYTAYAKKRTRPLSRVRLFFNRLCSVPRFWLAQNFVDRTLNSLPFG